MSPWTIRSAEKGPPPLWFRSPRSEPLWSRRRWQVRNQLAHSRLLRHLQRRPNHRIPGSASADGSADRRVPRPNPQRLRPQPAPTTRRNRRKHRSHHAATKPGQPRMRCCRPKGRHKPKGKRPLDHRLPPHEQRPRMQHDPSVPELRPPWRKHRRRPHIDTKNSRQVRASSPQARIFRQVTSGR